jgi:Mg2+/Co2+ transporter CorB
MMAALFTISGVVILLFLIGSALLSAAETALTRASRGRMHQLEREGDPAAKRVNKLISDQETMIGALLVAYNAINISASVMAGEIITRIADGLGAPAWVGVFLSTVVMTTLVVVFVEVLPKSLAIVRADDVARFLSGPILFIVRVLGPIIYGIQFIVRRTLGLFGIKMSMEMDVLAAHEEIRGAVEYHHAEGVVESADRRMLGGVLDLSEMDVGDVMVHRLQMDMLDADLSAKELLAEVIASTHSRIPLWREEPENVIGVLHAKDLLTAVAKAGGKLSGLDIPAMAREPWFVPLTTNLKEQLGAFLRKQSHFALVVDEYGALQGLVTLEDILEEIVGEIDDEHDLVVQGVRRQPDGTVNVNGDVTVRDLNRAMDWHLPDEDAVTVAGLVIHEAQAIPEPGQIFMFHGHLFQVQRKVRNQITLLNVSPRLNETEGKEEAE